MHPEDAGVYQVRVEDIPVFSTELDAECKELRLMGVMCNCNKKSFLYGKFYLGAYAKLSGETW